MIPAYLLLLLPPAAALIGAGARLVMRSRGRGGNDAASVRRFFQYSALFIAMTLTAEGVSLLLAEWWPSAPAASETSGFNPARAVAQTLAGLPALAVLLVWVRRTLRRAEERAAASWNVYLVGTSLIALGAAAYGAYRLTETASGLSVFRPLDATNLAVWGTAWLIHFRIAARARHAGPLRAGAFLGAWAGLWVMGWGAWRMGEQLLHLLLREAGGTVGEASLRADVLRAAAGTFIGGLIWVRYWVTIVSGMERDRAWRGAVRLAGTLSGLAAALVGLQGLLASGLEWLLGAGGGTDHFAGAPGMISLMLVGTVVWFFTGRASRPLPGDRRDEADRLFDYAGAGLGLVGAAAGAATALSALLRAALPGGEADWRMGLAGGLGLLAVALPMWLRFWSRAQRRRAVNPDLEASSPVRRAYLNILLGAGGLAALGGLLTAVFLAAGDILGGRWGWETLERVAGALAVLPTAGAVARYHLLLRRSDRLRAPQEADPGTKMAVLVSADGAAAAGEVEKQTGVRMWVWDSPEAGAASAEEIIALLDTSGEQRLLIAVDETGHRLLPFTPS